MRPLTYIRDGQAVDLVVVDQMRGPMIPCEWLEFGKIPLSGGEVSAAKLKGSTSKQLFTPDGWQLEGSLSQTFGFSPSSADRKGLRFLRREGSVDVYFNELTGKEVYVGRADGAGD